MAAMSFEGFFSDISTLYEVISNQVLYRYAAMLLGFSTSDLENFDIFDPDDEHLKVGFIWRHN